MTSTAMDNEPTQSEGEKNWLTEGILIFSVPVVAYILMLSFVIGYCDFFSIPVSFVSLNLPTMLWIGLRLEVGIFFLFFFAVATYWLLTLYDNTTTKKILALVPFAGLLVFEISLRLPWRDWRLTLVFLLLLIPSTLMPWPPNPRPILISPYTSKMLRTASLLLPWFIISVGMAMSMGRAVASRQRDYLVPASAPTTVVLSYFGERLVVAPFDRSTKEVEPSFWVIKTGEDPKLLLRWESVGPLHSKPVGGSSTPESATTPTQP
jgi:hypothetical protein